MSLKQNLSPHAADTHEFLFHSALPAHFPGSSHSVPIVSQWVLFRIIRFSISIIHMEATTGKWLK
jgi:hypothetical protein